VTAEGTAGLRFVSSVLEGRGMPAQVLIRAEGGDTAARGVIVQVPKARGVAPPRRSRSAPRGTGRGAAAPNWPAQP